MMEMTGRVKPSDNFIVKAGTTCSKPATNRRTQGITTIATALFPFTVRAGQEWDYG